MNNLRLFANLSRLASRTKIATTISTRKLYTDTIYPYPCNHINTKIYPSIVQYRESAPPLPWADKDARYARFLHVVFWTYIWWCFFWDPAAVGFGEHAPWPNPREWTDEELGIPPDSLGTYADWLASKVDEEE